MFAVITDHLIRFIQTVSCKNVPRKLYSVGQFQLEQGELQVLNRSHGQPTCTVVRSIFPVDRKKASPRLRDLASTAAADHATEEKLFCGALPLSWSYFQCLFARFSPSLQKRLGPHAAPCHAVGRLHRHYNAMVEGSDD